MPIVPPTREKVEQFLRVYYTQGVMRDGFIANTSVFAIGALREGYSGELVNAAGEAAAAVATIAGELAA